MRVLEISLHYRRLRNGTKRSNVHNNQDGIKATQIEKKMWSVEASGFISAKTGCKFAKDRTTETRAQRSSPCQLVSTSPGQSAPEEGPVAKVDRWSISPGNQRRGRYEGTSQARVRARGSPKSNQFRGRSSRWEAYR
jgi:hypothetical protein